MKPEPPERVQEVACREGKVVVRLRLARRAKKFYSP